MGSRGQRSASASAGSKSAGGGSLTSEQEEAIDFYASGEGMFVNNALRGVHPIELTSDEMAQIHVLDSVLTGNVGGTLYRSVDAEAIFGKMSQFDYSNLLDEVVYSGFSKQKGSYSQNMAKQINKTIDKAKGKTITDKGFVSTTKSETIANDWRDFTGSSKPVVMKITTGKNTKGKDISKATPMVRQAEKRDPQKEVLLARNQQYQVTNVYGKNGNIYVDVKMK